MAYMNQDRKKKIAEKVKPILKKYGVKGSLKTDRLSITLTIKSGPIDFIGDFNQDRSGRPDIPKEELRKHYSLDINPYWFQEHFGGESYHFLKEVITALKSGDWYDNSDAQIDYFDTAYYYHVNVGNWQTPYTITK
jgi:hypothetical protein